MSPPLDDLQAFACVARHRSFRKAAQELQLTPSALSHSMSRLEQQLGMRLLHRTTRSVSATEAGELLLQQLLPALGQIDVALELLVDAIDFDVIDEGGDFALLQGFAEERERLL